MYIYCEVPNYLHLGRGLQLWTISHPYSDAICYQVSTNKKIVKVRTWHNPYQIECTCLQASYLIPHGAVKLNKLRSFAYSCIQLKMQISSFGSKTSPAMRKSTSLFRKYRVRHTTLTIIATEALITYLCMIG